MATFVSNRSLGLSRRLRAAKVFWLVPAALCFGTFSGACGPSLASNLRHDPTTATAALGGPCGDEADVWLVDVGQDNLQQDIQASISEGKPLVVKFSCEKREVKVLRGCSVGGAGYKYQGYEYTQKAKQMNDSDEMGASLSGGPVVAAKFKAEFNRGSIFEIDYARAGSWHLTVDNVDKTQITGPDKCKEATHFIFGADIGAYTLNSGAKANVEAAAEIFGQGAHAQSQSGVTADAKGGDADKCKPSNIDDKLAHEGCAVPVVLHLRPIDAAPGASHGEASESGYSSKSCAAGQAPGKDGGCVSKSGRAAYQCTVGDVKDCQAQCSKGSPQSCVLLGEAYERAEGVSEDLGQAEKWYGTACDANEPAGCAGLGMVYSKEGKDAKDLLLKSCKAGAMRGCSGLGQTMRFAHDYEGAAKFFARACDGGYRRACFYAGMMVVKLNGSPDAALELYGMACNGGDKRGCLGEGALLKDSGDKKKGKQAISGALDSLKTECDTKNNYASCATVGQYYAGSYTGKSIDNKLARQYLDKACHEGKDTAACGDLKGL